jgi:hypothetical protein
MEISEFFFVSTVSSIRSSFLICMTMDRPQDNDV